MLTKYDFLLTSIQDKFKTTIKLLQEYGEIDPNLSLREAYDKYLAPDVLPVDDKEVWDNICNGKILDFFQFDSEVGSQGIKQVQPRNINDLAYTNGVIRLMAEDGKERPLSKYVRYKNDINLWYQEMENEGLTKEEQHVMERYLLESYGVGISQEQIMWSLMDKDICGFSLKEANAARKIISKKKMDKLPELKEKIMATAKSKAIGEYEWNYIVMPSAGYGFSIIHAISYSIIGFQSAYLATKWNSIYWNTACLIVDSDSIEEENDEEDDDYEEVITDEANEESDEEDEQEPTSKKNKAINYGKLAIALNKIKSAGINVVPPDINSAKQEFVPDPINNQIIYALKGLRGVGDKEIEIILQNRPYKDFEDFLSKSKIKTPSVISLIKAGAFDSMNKDRYAIMRSYIERICDKKTTLNMRNVNGLIERDLVPSELEFQRRLFCWTKYLKQKIFKYGEDTYCLDERSLEFIHNAFPEIEDDIHQALDGKIILDWKSAKKKYDKKMLPLKEYIADHQDVLLQKFNNFQFNTTWSKYCLGNISSWEMDSMSLYFHEHELANINSYKYQISDFKELPAEPEISNIYKIKGREIPIFKLTKIAGTCIAKNNIKKSFTLLTSDNAVITIRLSDEHYAYYNKQISDIVDGKKKVKEKSWFNTGTKLLIVGFRREDSFVPKKYKNTLETHRIYKITSVSEDGNIEYTSKRYGQGEEEE